MAMWKHPFLTVFLLFFAYTLLQGQRQTGLYPALLPANISTFDIDAGLPSTCTDGGLIDRRGRLWVNACYGQPEHRAFNFYLLDGKGAHTIELSPKPSGVDGQTFLFGQMSGAELYGAIRETDHFFFFNTETGNTRFFSLGRSDARILYMAYEEGLGLILYCSTDTLHCIYQFADEEPRLLKEIRRGSIYDSYREWRTHTPRILYRGELWFMDMPYRDAGIDGGTLLRYNCITGVVREYPLQDAFGRSIRADLYVTMYAAGDSIFQLDNTGWLYSLHIRNGGVQWKHLTPEISKATFITPVIASDATGNLLFITSYTESQALALLRDAQGRYYDYSAVMRTMSGASRFQQNGIRQVQGSDFREEIMAFDEGGLLVVDLKPTDGIQTYFVHRAIRGIVEMPHGGYMIVKDAGGLLDIRIDAPGKSRETQYHVTCDDSRGPLLADIRIDRNHHIWYPSERALIQLKFQSECIAYPIGTWCDRFVFLNDSVVVLTGEDQLLFYNIPRQNISRYMVAGIPLRIASPVNQILKSGDHILWIANYEGLWHIDLQAGTHRFYGLADGFQDNRIMCIDEADDGRIWAGTYSGGLQIFDPNTREIRILNTTNGLSNNTVINILKDDSGVRWLSTYSGITLVSPDGHVLTRLFEQDGLSTNEFNRYSSYKDSRGRLAFGSIRGLNVIEPEVIKARLLHREPLIIYFTAVTYHDPRTNTDRVMRYGFDTPNRLTLPAARRYLRLQYALSSYLRAEDKQFDYRIHGLHGQEGEWRSVGSNTELNLYDLPVGKYEIQIRGSDYRGNWTPEPLVLHIHAVGFFYQQPWFYAGIFLLIVALGIAWIRNERTKRHQLELIVLERTRQIREDRDTIEMQAQKLMELDAVKSRLFTNISHEFRTPLTVIEGMADHIDNDAKAPELIKRNARSLLNLVNQMLDLSKLEAGAMSLDLKRGDVVAFIRYISESYRSLAMSHALGFNFSSAVPEIIMLFDEEKLRQVLVNLLSNAIKFTREGEITLHLENTSVHSQDMLSIEVTDTGCGIPNDKLNEVFQRFHQLEPAYGTVQSGTGIGLTLVAELVKLMDGTISVSSETGKGTTFRVCIPITIDTAVTGESDLIPGSHGVTITEDAIQGLTLDGATHSPEKPSVLIAEDNRDVIHFLVTSLKKDYNLHIAENGQLGIDLALEIVPDIVVSDVMMPVKDGLALCETLKNDIRTSHIPIVLLTAKADIASRIDGLRRGADVYLAKPFNTEVLQVQLASLIASRRAMQARYRNTTIPESTEDPGLQIEDDFVTRLRELILANLDNEDFQVQQICEAIGMSRAHLHRKISALTGKSVTAFVRSIRLLKAREFLANPENNVTQVAFMVGFSYAESFSRAFHEEFGVPPSEFRQAAITTERER